MNEKTAWYLGIRSEKVALDLPWEDEPAISPFLAGTAGTGLTMAGINNLVGNELALNALRSPVIEGDLVRPLEKIVGASKYTKPLGWASLLGGLGLLGYGALNR